MGLRSRRRGGAVVLPDIGLKLSNPDAALRRLHVRLNSRIRATKRLNNPWLSRGPGEASGWYCTEKTGRSLSARPQLEPSNSDTWVSTALAGRRRAVDREAVVHRGDLDLAGRRDPSPDGWRRDGPDASSWSWRRPRAPASGGRGRCRRSGFCSISVADHRHRIFAGRRRIARAVGEENAVGLERQNVGGRGLSPAPPSPCSRLPASWRRMLRLMP